MLLKTQSLSNVAKDVIIHKGTEPPFSGETHNALENGTYLCRQCGLALFRSKHQFHSACGWPSFDEQLENVIKFIPDSDHIRTEIVCARCQAHLGHVFHGEQYTTKNVRYCVNAISLDFVKDKKILDTEEAIFAAGCFWGVEYLFQQLTGVVKTEVGYAGGTVSAPTYEKVCSGQTGHYEVIRVVYDPKIISYENLAKFFFEIHDPTQKDGQGNDKGQQYLSIAFFYNDEQKTILENLIAELQQLHYEVATKLLPVSTFWPAESYHQNYYQNNGERPYCHFYQKKFIQK